MGQREAESPTESAQERTTRRLMEAEAALHLMAEDFLRSKRRGAKIVLEIFCDDGLITQPVQLMGKCATGT